MPSSSRAAAMVARDRASAALGMRVEHAAPGAAVVSMLVTEQMLNGYDVAHGGVIFSLADTAFAVACQEHDAVTLAAGADIAFLRPARAGERLVATAERRSLTGRSGIYDVRVVTDAGETVAEFRGRSRTTDLPTPDRTA